MLFITTSRGVRINGGRKMQERRTFDVGHDGDGQVIRHGKRADDLQSLRTNERPDDSKATPSISTSRFSWGRLEAGRSGGRCCGGIEGAIVPEAFADSL